jgi:hypothetical protein
LSGTYNGPQLPKQPNEHYGLNGAIIGAGTICVQFMIFGHGQKIFRTPGLTLRKVIFFSSNIFEF